MTEPVRFLFSYGTLRPGAGPWARRLSREARCVGPARIRGRSLQLGPWPGLRLLSGGAPRLPGVLWALRAPARSLRWLDRYEGRDYQRRIAAVLGPRGWQRAWVYVLRSGRGVPAWPQIADPATRSADAS